MDAELGPIILGTVFLFITIAYDILTFAGSQNLFSLFMSRAMSEESSQTFTMGLNATLAEFVALLAIVVLMDSMRKWQGYLVRKDPLENTEIFEDEDSNAPTGP